MKSPTLIFTAFFMLVNWNCFSQELGYMGSEACKDCHNDVYDMWIVSGHATGFTLIENNQPPVFPEETINYQGQWMDSLGDGTHDWSQVAAIAGGYGWLTRFIGYDGIIIGTASSSLPDSAFGHNQHNFYDGVDHGWSDYNDTLENQFFNYACFKCHTTGADTAGTWLPGVDGMGSFFEIGTGCESCHGPGSKHIATGGDYQNIDMVYEFAHQDNTSGGLTIGNEVLLPSTTESRVNFLCGTCHSRNYDNKIEVNNGFIWHHEQWDEFASGVHYQHDITCSSCHHPHKRVIWDGDGIIKGCINCHPAESQVLNHAEGVSCIDCHMPYASNSGIARGESGYVGDVRSHLFKIIPDTASMFTTDGKWVKDDEDREAALDLGFACLGCHNHDPNDSIFDKTIEMAAATAKGMHLITSVTTQKDLDLRVYPNPSQGPIIINFSLYQAQPVSMEVYNVSGQSVYRLNMQDSHPGTNKITWDGSSNTDMNIQPGYYFIKVAAGKLNTVKKVVLIN